MAIISLVFATKSGEVYKTIKPPRPHAGRHGEFIWVFKNEIGSEASVDLRDFAPTGFVDIETPLPVTVQDGKRGVAVGTVTHANVGDITVTYSVYVNASKIDPDLVIDGDGGIPPPKGGKKTDGKTGTSKKKPGKEKVAKKKGAKKR